MSTNSSYCSNVNLPKRSKEIQREASKAAESLERLLCLAKRGEDVKSKKSEEAIDFAIEKLRFLKSSTVQLGELKQVIENLENVVTEKKFEGRKRLEEISCKVEETRMQVEALSREREVLSAQVMAGNALCKLEKVS